MKVEEKLKLTTVNRASLHELLLDYEDYLRVRGLEQWAYNDPRCIQTRAFCKAHLDPAIYREKIKDRTDETIANIAITLIHQCDILIRGLIEWKKRDFLEKGGIKEEMYQARKNWQKKNGAYGAIPYEGHGFNGSNGVNGQSIDSPTSPKPPIQPIKPKNRSNKGESGLNLAKKVRKMHFFCTFFARLTRCGSLFL